MGDLNDKINKDFIEGTLAQEHFIKFAERDGYKCVRANNYQDRHEHWDVMLVKDDKVARVDVKMFKESHKSGYTWVELQAVNGKKGWVKGKAHVIAFELEDRFILVNRLKLCKMVEKKIMNPTGYVYVKPKNLGDIAYHRYRRMGRRDILMIVPFSDMEEYIMTTIMK